LTLTRQGGVFVARFFGSSLQPAPISQLNYAQKVARVPMVVALVITAVTFQRLARSIAAGEGGKARRALESDLRVISMLVLVAAACLLAFAPAGGPRTV
jgi:putative peptidoglycan lipid II flippase